jgi:preprotein translocase subunit SecB
MGRRDSHRRPYFPQPHEPQTMTDVPPDAPADAEVAAPPPGPGIRVLAQFTRDFSFENPRAPDSLRSDGPQPAIEIGVEMRARGRPDGLFEIDLKLSTTASANGQTTFQVELLYGGLFEVVGVEEDMLEPMLLIEGPRFLFPFARQIISTVTGDGGFPPFQLEPIDFAAVYAAQRSQREGNMIQNTVGNA